MKTVPASGSKSGRGSALPPAFVSLFYLAVQYVRPLAEAGHVFELMIGTDAHVIGPVRLQSFRRRPVRCRIADLNRIRVPLERASG